MLTPDQFLSIIKSRNLGVIPLSTPDASIKWRAITSEGERATGKNTLYPTPEEAIEAADNHYREVESQRTEQMISQAILALSRGDFYVKSEDIPDPANPTERIRTFTGYRSNNQPSQTVRNRLSFVNAVLEMEKETLNERSARSNSR